MKFAKLAIFLAAQASVLGGICGIARANPPANAGYNLVFSDNFTGSALDQTKWSTNYPWGTYHNGRANMQPSQVTVGDGALTLKAEARRSIWEPWGVWREDFGWLDLDYTSGAIHTNGKKRFSKGYFEGRFKMPAQLSTWPAFWMLQDGWPPELDVLEVQGDRARTYYNYHYTNNGSHASFGGQKTGIDLSAAYHTYGVEWTDTQLNYYFDDQLVQSYTNPTAIQQMNAMYLIINLQVGGWAPAPDAADYPAEFKCDWVRVYQKNAGPASGLYRLVPKNAPAQSLEVGGWNTANGAAVNIWPYGGGANQQWLVDKLDGGYRFKTNMTWANRALDLSAGNSANGTKVQLWDNTGNGAQRWHLEDAGNGYYHIAPINNPGAALDIEGGAANPPAGNNVFNWEYLGGAGQQWKLIKVSDDTFLQLGAADFRVAEDAGNATITINRTGNLSFPVSVKYATSDGSALVNQDYTAAAGTLNFAINQTSATFSVPLLNDTATENDETIKLTLSEASASGVAGPRATGTVTIADNDALPTLAVADLSLAEGDSETKNAILTVQLSAPATQAASVKCTTSDGSAKVGEDFSALDETLDFAIGEQQKTLEIPIVGDKIWEDDETFFLDLSGATGATVARARATVTIQNDDALPEMSVADVSLVEGDSGTRNAVFTVRLPAPANRAASVNYATSDDTAKTGEDYSAANGQVLFAIGEQEKTIEVAVLGDKTIEPDETFALDLSGATGATLSRARALGTIQNDDLNNAPTSESLAPNAGSSSSSVARTLSVIYSDLDGQSDILEARVIVGTAINGGAGALYGYYNARYNKLYLYNDRGTSISKGYAPGSNAFISNSQGTLNCKDTTVVREGNTLKVNWNFTPNGFFTGAKNVYSFVSDLKKARQNFKLMGTWNIELNSGNDKPLVQSLAPNLSTSGANVARSFLVTYGDPDGVSDIAQVRVLVNGNAGKPNALYAFYDASSNKLYLSDNAGTGLLGGFAPGSANVISNKQGTLNCAQTAISRGGNSLAVNWNFTPAATFTGTKRIYAYVRDKAGWGDGLRGLGTWNITATASGNAQSSGKTARRTAGTSANAN